MKLIAGVSSNINDKNYGTLKIDDYLLCKIINMREIICNIKLKHNYKYRAIFQPQFFK